MNNTQKLIKLINENPGVPVITMVDSNIVGNEDARYMGAIGDVELSEIALIDGNAYYKEEIDDLVDYIVKAVLHGRKDIISIDELEKIEANAKQAAEEMFTLFIKINVDFADTCEGYDMNNTARTMKAVKKKMRTKKFGISIRNKEDNKNE